MKKRTIVTIVAVVVVAVAFWMGSQTLMHMVAAMHGG